jgi:cytochrome c biogenesis protein CcdA
VMRPGLTEKNKETMMANYAMKRSTPTRSQAKVKFYWHTVNFVLGIGFLIVIYLFSCLVIGDFYHPWFIYPAIVWGIALTVHFIRVYLRKDRNV